MVSKSGNRFSDKIMRRKSNSTIGRTIMLPTMSRKLFGVTLAAGLVATALPATAQTYPSSSVHLIVAYAAGGTGDVVARIVAPKLSIALGQSVVVENRAGASGTTASSATGCRSLSGS